MAYQPGALYYAVTAQLEGSGDISDSVIEVVTTWCSDGTKHAESFPLASGYASGGYNIARAEYAGTPGTRHRPNQTQGAELGATRGALACLGQPHGAEPA